MSDRQLVKVETTLYPNYRRRNEYLQELWLKANAKADDNYVEKIDYFDEITQNKSSISSKNMNSKKNSMQVTLDNQRLNKALMEGITSLVSSKVDEIKYETLIGEREIVRTGESVEKHIAEIAKGLIKSSTVERMKIMRSRYEIDLFFN